MRQKLPILVYPDLVSGVFYIFIHQDCGESGLFMFCVYKLSIIPSDSPMVGTITSARSGFNLYCFILKENRLNFLQKYQCGM